MRGREEPIVGDLLDDELLVGIANYFGLPDNSRSLHRLYGHVVRSLYKWLNRRCQRRSYNKTLKENRYE